MNIPRPVPLCFLLFLWAACSSWALDPNLQISQYAHTAWNARDGAFRGGMQSITQTTDGYLWIGTSFGLLRFDGVRFVEWQPPKNRVFPKGPFEKIYASRDGSLWVGGQGLARLRNGKVTSYPQLENISVKAIREDKEGTVWVGGLSPPKTKLCSIREDQVQCFGEDGTFGEWINSIYEDPAGNLWVGSSPGVWRWKPGAPKLYPGNGETAATDLAMDNNGTILVASRHELRALIGGKDQPYPIRIPGDPLQTRSLLKDKDGGIWIGTGAQGLIHLHQGRVDTYRQEDGLSGDVVFSLLEDREGNIWVVTPDGLDRFRELAVSTITTRQGFRTDHILSVLATKDGSVWIGTYNGLHRIKEQKVDIYLKNSGLPDNVTESMLEDRQGRLLISTNTIKGYAWLDKGKFVRANIPAENAFSMAQDSSGHYWISDREVGLIHLGPSGEVSEITPWSKFNLGAALSVAADPLRAGLWLGFTRTGLAFLKDGKIAELYSPWQGFEGQVRDVQVDEDGTVWASTGAGLSRLRDGKVAVLNSKNGLPCDTVHWKKEDDEGNVWLLTSCGLVRLAKSELDAWAENPLHQVTIISTFDNTDGVQELTINGYYTPYVTKTADGRLFFTKTDGVAVLDPHRLPFNKLKPPTVIEQITADGKDYEVSSSPVSLPPLARDLRIDYTALSFVDPRKVRFRYKLEGHDANWQDPGTRRQAFYSDLRPGRYRFRVIACNNDGVWNEEGATLDFRVAPAWYQTIWFRAACLGTLGLFLWAIYQLRLRQLKRQFNMRLEERVGERTRIARELHDTLLQSFHGLLFRFQAARNMLPRRLEEAMQAFDGAIVRAEQAIAESRDAIQGLRSEPEDQGDLTQLLTAIGQELAGSSGGNGDSPIFRVMVGGEPRVLGPLLQDELYRIAREVLRNAFLHARARQIEVEIRYDDDSLRLLFRDDGRGIDPKVLEEGGRAGHWGLRGVRERAQQIGAQLEFWSKAGAGTEVQMTVPATTAYKIPRNGPGFRLFRKAKNHEY